MNTQQSTMEKKVPRVEKRGRPIREVKPTDKVGENPVKIRARKSNDLRKSPQNVAITGRFFWALKRLVEKGEIHSVYEFSKSHGINHGNLYALETQPERLTLPVMYLYFLVHEHRVSAQWLLTGEGPWY